MRIVFKRAVLCIAFILVSPFILFTLLGRYIGKESPTFILSSQALSIIPGLPGDYLRTGFYKYTLKSVGMDSLISFGSIFSKRSVEIGNNVLIGAYCIIGNVKFGDHVMVASRVSLLSGKYQHGSALVPMPACLDKCISIGSRTWIGEGAIVAADVGADCIVAAGSVVMRNVPDGYMAAGNPAKLIRMGSANSTEQINIETSVPTP